MAPRTQTQIRSTRYLLDKTTILIVDDEPGPRESLRLILSPAHKVIACQSGAEALEFLGTTEVDLVTIDLNMPGMKGDELMRTIRREFPAVEIIIITGFGTVGTAVEGLRHGICDYISKPFDVAQVSSAVERALSRKQSRARMVEFLEGIGSVLGKDRDSRALIEELKANPELPAKLLAATQDSAFADEDEDASRDDSTYLFLDVLAQALESRDSHLRGHAERVAEYAELLAKRIGADAGERERVKLASFLHDFGKLGLSRNIEEPAQQRSNANGPTLEDHPRIGARLVEPLGLSEEVVAAIRHHHESWDGDGFPDGLAGNEIPLTSRIIALVDAFDTLVSQRTGERGLSQEAAIEELEKQAGIRFDPGLVGEFISILEGTVRDGAISSLQIEQAAD
jgi:putative nucleotidyltransferase with HDIG domain